MFCGDRCKLVPLLRRNEYSVQTIEDWSLINMTDTDSVNYKEGPSLPNQTSHGNC